MRYHPRFELKTPRTRVPFGAVAGYGALILLTVAAFLMIRARGEGELAPPALVTSPAAATAPIPDALPRVLIALVAILVLGQVLARVFAYLRQPPVIGEVVAGILLGPSLLGPELSAWVLPTEVAPHLRIIGQVGVILYMFLVGLELNPALIRERAWATAITAHASIAVPFVLGAVLALGLYPRLSSSAVPFTSFALFMGVAMSITAFPVLARILADSGMTRTKLGVLALSCAAIGDVTAWCLLAFVVGVVQAKVGSGIAVALAAGVYVAAMVLVARPVLKRLAARWEAKPDSRGSVSFVFVALLLSALASESIGIHALFGAFLLGAIVPHDSALARDFTRQLAHVVTLLLLPAFFAFTGMRTRIDLLAEPGQWWMAGAVIATAIAGKFGGTFVAARWTGLPTREATILGALMNTRGLMELIVLNVGLELGVVSPTLFAMLVLMALVTTMLTSPVLWLLGTPATSSSARSGPAPA